MHVLPFQKTLTLAAAALSPRSSAGLASSASPKEAAGSSLTNSNHVSKACLKRYLRIALYTPHWSHPFRFPIPGLALRGGIHDRCCNRCCIIIGRINLQTNTGRCQSTPINAKKHAVIYLKTLLRNIVNELMKGLLGIGTCRATVGSGLVSVQRFFVSSFLSTLSCFFDSFSLSVCLFVCFPLWRLLQSIIMRGAVVDDVHCSRARVARHIAMSVFLSYRVIEI